MDAEAQIYTRRKANGVIEATNVPAARDFRLTYPGKGTLIHSRGFRMRPYNGEFDAHILAASAAFGVSADLVRAIIQVESEFDPFAVSSAGARGLMQLMPATAARFGVANSFDPRQNIFGGVQYLRFLIDMFHGDLTRVAAGYNAGENAVLKYGGVPPYKETIGYVDKVEAALNGGVGTWAAVPRPPAKAPASYYAPNATGVSATARAKSGGRVAPARPRTYYRWTDAAGIVHVAQSPPQAGTQYSMIRALD